MAASRETISEAADVLIKHVGLDKAEEIVKELRSVGGNQSFQHSVLLLHQDLITRQIVGKSR